MDIRKLLVFVISDFILNLVFLYPATCMAQIWVEIGTVFGSVSLTDTAAQTFSKTKPITRKYYMYYTYLLIIY